MAADMRAMWRGACRRTHIHKAMPRVMSKAMVRAIASGRAVRPGQTPSQMAPNSPMPTTIESVISRYAVRKLPRRVPRIRRAHARGVDAAYEVVEVVMPTMVGPGPRAPDVPEVTDQVTCAA